MMRDSDISNFAEAIEYARTQLLYMSSVVDTGRWQGVPTEGKPDLMTRELLNFSFDCPVDRYTVATTLLDELASEVRPNRLWADEHFAERVGGVPHNPDPSHERWPWWKGQSAQSKVEDIGDSGVEGPTKLVFSHTYSERFWPKQASTHHKGWGTEPMHGIRYDYGDLNDLLTLMLKEPYGRQAYLPIFFPEDTGAVHGGRIPCTLGYWFVLRDNRLHMTYYIRSCDYVRHFRDDIYLAVRLQLWVLEELWKRAPLQEDPWVHVTPGTFTMHIGSLHFHEGDRHHV